MKTSLIFAFSLIGLLYLGCGGEEQAQEQPRGSSITTPPCTTNQPGLINVSSTETCVYQPMLPGQCNTSDDCPSPYNKCAHHQCVVVALSNSDTRLWFATDPIRPAVATNFNPTLNTNPFGYKYNIMAKGYQSLNDWCKTQAQQSNQSSMRQVQKWKALVASNVENQQEIVTDWYSVMGDTWTGLYDPSGTTKWTKGSNTIYDKHGVAVGLPNITYTNYWSGLMNSNPVARAQNQSCMGNPTTPGFSGCSKDCLLVDGACYNDRVACNGYYNPWSDGGYGVGCYGCYAGTDINPTSITPDTVNYIAAQGTPPWSGFQQSNAYGVAILTPLGCVGGIAHMSYYPNDPSHYSDESWNIYPSGVSANPIICVETTERAASGDLCVRSTDCTSGLACLGGKCSSIRIMFTTSTSYPTISLGNNAINANRLCQTAAYSAGSNIPIGKTFVALISNTSWSAYDRISKSLSNNNLWVVNMRGELVFNRASDLNSNATPSAGPWYDSAGNTVTASPWTGSTAPNTPAVTNPTDSSCQNWTSSASGNTALIGSGSTGSLGQWWNSRSWGCQDSGPSLLCIEADPPTGTSRLGERCTTNSDCQSGLACLSGICDDNRIIFTTSTSYSTTLLGTNAINADRLCQIEANSAGSRIRPGTATFVALISTSAQSAYNRISTSLSANQLKVVNILGETVFNQTSDLNSTTTPQNGPWYDPTGNPVTAGPWTGSTAPNAPGTPDTTCQNWANSSSGNSAGIGVGSTGSLNQWWSSINWGCQDSSPSLLCIEADQ